MMIKNHRVLKKFEDNFIRDEGRFNYRQAIKLLENMWIEGVNLGVLPPKEPLEGIEVDIKVAEILHSCLKKYCPE